MNNMNGFPRQPENRRNSEWPCRVREEDPGSLVWASGHSLCALSNMHYFFDFQAVLDSQKTEEIVSGHVELEKKIQALSF